MDASAKVFALLHKFKCEKLRSKNHLVYRLPSGQRFTMAKTPGAKHSAENCLSDLRIALGISRRGKAAQESPSRSSPKKRRKPQGKSLSGIKPAPIAFSFGEKVRAAMKGEKPSHPEPLPPLPKEKPVERFRKPIMRRDRVQHGAVRVWSANEIAAANIAMRVGKLNEFMQEHDQAVNTPGTQSKKENAEMLTIEQMDGTITELEAGMVAALDQVKIEQSNIQRLQTEIEQAQQRMQAATDKHNSLNDVRTSLAVLRGDIEKVRPMLGHLAQKPAMRIVSNSGTRIKLRDAIRTVLDQALRPIPVGQVYKEITKLPGCESVARTSLYTFFAMEQKRNGDAVSRRVGANLYWPVSRELPAASA